MGINWNNVIKDQARGMDAASAFYREQRRQHEKSSAKQAPRDRGSQRRHVRH